MISTNTLKKHLRVSKCAVAVMISISLSTTANAMPSLGMGGDRIDVEMGGGSIQRSSRAQLLWGMGSVCVNALASFYKGLSDYGLNVISRDWIAGVTGTVPGLYGTALGMLTYPSTQSVYFNRPSTGTVLTATTVTAITYACVIALRHTAQAAFYNVWMLKFAPHINDGNRAAYENRARWYALLTLAVMWSGATFATGYFGVQATIRELLLPTSDPRRALLGNGNTYDSMTGNERIIAERWKTFFNDLYYDGRGWMRIPHVPGLTNGVTWVQEPSTIPRFENTETFVNFMTHNYPADTSVPYSARYLGVSPAGFHAYPMKYMRDSHGKDWILSRKDGANLRLYRRSANDPNGNYERIPNARFIDIYPGDRYIWAVSADSKIYKCALPCNPGTHKFVEIAGRARAIAVGPDRSGNNRVWVIGIDRHLTYFSVAEEVHGNSPYRWRKEGQFDTPDHIVWALHERTPSSDANTASTKYNPSKGEL